MTAVRLGRAQVRAIEEDVRRAGIEPGMGVDIERVLSEMSKPTEQGGLGVPVGLQEFDREPGEPSAVTYAFYDGEDGEGGAPLEYVVALARELVGPLRVVAFLHEVCHLRRGDPVTDVIAGVRVRVPPGARVRHARFAGAHGGDAAEQYADLWAMIGEHYSRIPPPEPLDWSHLTSSFGGEE